MAASGTGRFGPEAKLSTWEAEEASAFLAWRGAVQSARSVLLEASRLYAGDGESGSGAGLGAVLVGLRELEFQMDGHLAGSPGQPRS